MNYQKVLINLCLFFSTTSLGAELEPWLQEADSKPVYHYPYPGLSKELNEDHLLLFSYGSLLIPESCRDTFSEETTKTMEPAVAFGFKRLFNRDIPIKPESRWGIPDDPDARGMLNLEKTNNEKDIVNGMLMKISLEELEAMSIREIGYDLVPCVCMSWSNLHCGTCCEYVIAYTLVAKGEYVNDKISPRPNYLKLIQRETKRYGSLYYHMWLLTTYTSDGMTLIKELDHNE